MGLLKRLIGGEGPSREELQRQADEEISQMVGQNRPPETDEPMRPPVQEEPASHKEPATK